MDFCAKRYNAIVAPPTDGNFRDCGSGRGFPDAMTVPTKKPPWVIQGGLMSVSAGCQFLRGPVSAGQALIALALHPLAHQFADAAGRFGSFAGAALRRLFIGPTVLHLAEHAFTLQLFLEHAECLVNIVFSYGYVHGQSHPS